MNRFATRTSQFLIDVIVLSIAFTLAALIRFDWDVPSEMLRRLLFVLPYVVLLQYTMLTFFGITRFSWRFISLRDVVRILLAITAAAAVLLVIRLAGEPLARQFKPLRYALVPIGVLLADSLLAFLAVTGVRVLRRLIGERITSQQYQRGDKSPERTVLVGAGQGGVLVAQEIMRRADLAIKPVAFVDDDPVKVGSVIHGIKVLGTTKDLAHICESQRITQALITISGAPGTAIRRITDDCKAVGLKVKIVPGTYQIMDGRVNLSRIRDVAIDDLLRRQPVRLDSTEVTAVVRGKRVLITGAGGSIGAELCRQSLLYEPTDLVLVERAENNLFEIHRELQSRFPERTIVPCLADITDAARMEELFHKHRPQTIFHAAAHKHVPMMEWNPGEAVKNNTLGTKTVADFADRFACERFVLSLIHI